MNHNSDNYGKISIKVLDTMHRSIDHRDSRPKGSIYIMDPVSMAQGTSWKRGWKEFKSQDLRKFAVKTVSPTKGCINKRTRPLSMGMLAEHGRYTINTSTQDTEGQQQKWIRQVVFIQLCMHGHVSLYILIHAHICVQ